MARKPSPTLTEAEHRLMDALWTLEKGTVANVVQAIGDPPLAYNTVLTTLRILEEKGFVRHKAVGRAFLYAPRIAREDAQRSAVQNVVSRFFSGSRQALVLNLIESGDVDDAELGRLRAQIERAGKRSK